MQIQVTSTGFDWGKFPEEISKAIDKSLMVIGMVASTKYMIAPGGKGLPVNPSRLTWRSGRLAYSLQRKNDPEAIHFNRTISGRWEGVKGTKVPYASLHEYGGRYTRSTSKGMVKLRQVTVPVRPFLNKAIKDPQVQEGIKNIFEKHLKAIFSK